MKITVPTLKKLLALVMVFIIASSVAVWWRTRSKLPDEIQVATGASGGLYHRLASLLAEVLEAQTGHPVKAIATLGSLQNREALLSGAVDLAILQSGSVDMGGLSVLTPLYHEPTMVIARADSGIVSVEQLHNRRVVLGPRGSGMRHSAQRLLRHYRIETLPHPISDAYFTALGRDPQAEAAIVTTGLLNPDLRELFQQGNFKLLSIEDTEALAMLNPTFERMTIPRGFFSERPAVPPSPVRTVATTAVLAARKEPAALLISETLAALYEGSVRQKIPILIPARQAQQWDGYPLHPEAQSYFDPYGGLGVLANFTEFLSGIKELLFAFCAAGYLSFDRWRSFKKNQRQRHLQALKDRLDAFLNETVRIEREQMETEDPQRLRHYLDEVTRIKLRALEELTHEDLRGDNHFAIFLMQCANLIRKIQSKIS